MFRVPRFLAPLVVLLLFACPAVALAAPSASIEQVRNGVATSPVTPVPSWGTGNAGASNSHYLESHSTAYRAVMNDLPTDGTVVELVIGYDVKRSGSYALDYLTHYQRLLPHVLFGHRAPEVFDPLSGITGVDATVTTAPIPVPTRNLLVDPDGTGPEPAASQPGTSASSLAGSERVMTLFGGNLIDVTYVNEADVNLATGSSESQVRVRFTATSPRAVLAWGGHIACRWDWGFNADGSPRSAGGIKGSSYHMRLVGWNFGSLGNQDRSMSTDAVYPVPKCGISNAGPFCAGSTNVHAAPAGMESYVWTLFDNTCGATIVGSDTSLSVTVRSATAGSYGLMVTTGASGFTKQCQTTVIVNAPPTADAGADQTACAASPQVALAGVVGGGTATWSGGAGSFNPNSAAPNAIYTPTAAEITAGGVTLTLTVAAAGGPCPSASDAMRVTFQKLATAQAGADQTLCASQPQAQLAGAVGGSAATGTWSGGGGSFSPSAAALNAVYSPSAAEIAAGTVTLTLASEDPVGPCGAATDAVTLTFLPSATADAGPDASVCSASPQVHLAGVVGGGATSGTWSGGTGSFSPNASALNAFYTPSASEMAAGGVTLVLTTNDPAGPCLAVNDAMRITILPAATAQAGADGVVCAAAPQATLAGSVGGGATSGTWTGGTGSFAPDRSDLHATYLPSAAEIAAGSVTLTLVTNDPAGPCDAASDAVTIVIQPVATVNAGADQTVCASSPRVSLAGVVGGAASGGTWSGGAGSFSPRATALDASYTPTAAEVAAGRVTLTLTTNDPSGPCPPMSDAMTITIDPVTLVNAGLDRTVCATSPQVTLAGSVTGTVSGGTWSGGAGTFAPGPNSLNAVYTPSASEILAGSVTLTLTSAFSSRPCPPASDAMIVTIRPAATVNAGPDQTVCAASPQVRLAGAIGGSASGAAWSGGAGTYQPGPTTLGATYNPTAAEVAAGSVILTLTTNDPDGPCPVVSDDVRITFDAPSVTVADRVVCSGIPSVTLCANPGRGVSPFTWRWSNGATTACITVSDTGRYTVTMTDARGCQATSSGAFGYRDCVGQLTHTVTTCDTYMQGLGQDLPSSDIHWVTRDGVITSISPGVFFYWTKVTAPRADFKIQIEQTRSDDAYPFLSIQQDQVALYDADCNRIGTGVETSPGQGEVAVHGATTGQVFLVAVKYSLKDLIGSPLDENTGVHYDFRTWIDGQLVDSDPDGLQIGAPTSPTSSEGGPGDTEGNLFHKVGGGRSAAMPDDDLAVWRPAPNPFRDGMRMAYVVAAAEARVTIGIYDLAGRRVRTLVDERQAAGRHSLSWDGRGDDGTRQRTGVYFVHARIGADARRVSVTFLE